MRLLGNDRGFFLGRSPLNKGSFRRNGKRLAWGRKSVMDSDLRLGFAQEKETGPVEKVVEEADPQMPVE